MLVDPARIGLGLTVFVEIEAADHTLAWREAVGELVSGYPEIVEIHRMTGGVDYLLKVVVPDMAAYDAFHLDRTRRLPFRNVASRFSIEQMKATTVLPIDISPP